MDVKVQLKAWRTEATDRAKRRREQVSLVRAHAELLERLPYDLSFQMVYDGKIRLVGTAESGEKAKELAAEVRQILGVKESKKELNSGSGLMMYVTETDTIRIAVNGGDIPENCKLIPMSNSYITYEMVCPEGEQAS